MFRNQVAILTTTFAMAFWLATAVSMANAEDYWWTVGNGTFRNAANWGPSWVTGYPDDTTDDAVFVQQIDDLYTVTFDAPYLNPTITNRSFLMDSTTVYFNLTTQDPDDFYVPVTYVLDPPILIGEPTIAAHVEAWFSPSTLVIGGLQGLGPDIPTVEADGQLWIGQGLAGYEATLQIGSDTLGTANWTSNWSTIVGGQSDGNLIIHNGKMTNSYAILGREPGSFGEVTVRSNGEWESTQRLVVGNGGTGWLYIRGGSATNRDAWIAAGEDSIGVVEVTDGTWVCHGSLYVGGNDSGSQGYGVITMGDGFANVVDDITVWQSGTLSVSGGIFQAQGETTIDEGTLSVWGGGEFKAVGGSSIANNGGTVTGDGTIRLSGASLVNNGGVVAPGGVTSVLNIADGDFLQDSAGTLEIELGGTAVGERDVLIVDGDVELGGLLDVSLVGGFEPSVGDRFQIISADSVLHTFDDRDLPGQYDWSVIYKPDSVALEVLAAYLDADFDHDGDVDGADFLSWQRGFGITTGAQHADGDATGEGTVNGDDLDIWQTQFGDTGTAAANGAAVPEPAASVLLAIGAALLPWLRQRRCTRLGVSA